MYVYSSLLLHIMLISLQPLSAPADTSDPLSMNGEDDNPEIPYHSLYAKPSNSGPNIDDIRAAMEQHNMYMK